MKPTYWTKAPYQSFARPRRGYTRDLHKMMARIEYLSRFTGNPWLQLVEETDAGYKVVAEYRNHSPHGWVNPLQAAGFAAIPGK